MNNLIYILAFSFICLNIKSNANGSATDTTKINKNKIVGIIITESVFYIGGMGYLQFVWYKDHERVPFHFYNDLKGYLQVDKMGHAFGSYLESYISYHWLRSAGVKKKHALLYGATAGIILQTPIELFDGIYEGWGFSNSDLIANTLGSVFLIGQELLFDEQIAKYKFSFSRSGYARQSNGYLGKNFGESLLLDYNGHTYWVSFGLSRIMFKDKLPNWLSLAVGYSGNGMFGEFSNKTSYIGVLLPETKRYRQLLVSLDVDWTKIKTENRFLNKLFQGMFFIKMPSPTFEINSLGEIKGYGVYF